MGFYYQLVELLKFPLFKPLAFLQIDDRAMTFKGKFPSVEEMKDFKPFRVENPLVPDDFLLAETEKPLRPDPDDVGW